MRRRSREGRTRDTELGHAVQDGTYDGATAIGQLQDYLQRLERNLYGWRAAHLHLSRLKAHNRRAFQLRVVANEFEPLLRRQKGDLFQLPGGDMIYLWDGEEPGEVDRVVLRLRYLFSDDPLVSSRAHVSSEERDEVEPDAFRFCSWYDLERDYQELLDRVEVLGRRPVAGARPSAPPGKPLDPATLARAERTLSGMDVSPMIRRQPICALLPNQPPQPLFAEVHVAIGELAKLLTPGVDPTSDLALFQRLVETLDRRLLTALAAGGPEGAISINLRLASLLSPEFLSFDQRFRGAGKAEVIIELQVADIFAELGAYMFIRGFLRERGYRICIDGLHHLHLPLISRKRLGADLVKLVWSPDLLDEVEGERLSELRNAIRTTGVDRVILCRCDSSEATDWGEALGLRLFQGYYLDSRLRAKRAPAIDAARAMLRSRAS